VTAGAGPPPEVVAATLRAFLDACGGADASALLDRGEAEPVLVEVDMGSGAEPDTAPLPLPHVHAFAPFEVDAERAEIGAPPGAVAHLATAVRELAGRLGGRSVLTVRWATSDAAAPFAVAARVGDPVVLALGEEPFEMPAEWP
jgi:hypothetical protein